MLPWRGEVAEDVKFTIHWPVTSAGSASSRGTDNQPKEEKSRPSFQFALKPGITARFYVFVSSARERWESFKMLIGRLPAKGGKHRDKKMPGKAYS